MIDNRLFLFDLDSTLTKVEILPTIAEAAGCAAKMRDLTEKGMYQAVPFTESFLDRVELLKSLPVSEVSERIAKIPLHEGLVSFIQRNKERCYIVTGNLDVWIDELVKRMGMEGHVFCSKGIVRDDRLVGVASVIDKQATVGQLVTPFVAVGDGSNDAEMISRAEIGIGFGGVRPIAPSVLEVATHAIYDESRLVVFLQRLAGETQAVSGSKTAVISCAGMGRRLGIGTTKCLVEIDGESMLSRHINALTTVDDLRVVVGYQAQKVIDAAVGQRRDIMFVFNHDYAHNGTGASVSLAAANANEYILTLDGDLLVHPSDVSKILAEKEEFVGVSSPGTDNPVLCSIAEGNVTSFSREFGSFEWTGVMQCKSAALSLGDGHVYQLIEPLLPMKYLYVRTKEVDTPNDYLNAVRWVKNGYSDEVSIGVLGGMGTYATLDIFKRIVEAFPAEKEWDRPHIIIDNYCTMPSRVRALLYGDRRQELTEMLVKSTKGLMDSGCTHIMYACNTAHAFQDDVCASLPEARGYLIDMIDLLASEMKCANVAEAFLLASEGTIDAGVYQDRFAPYGIKVIPAGADDQILLRRFIEMVKQGKLSESAYEEFYAYLNSIKCENIILGCTELPILYEGGFEKMSGSLESCVVWDPIESAVRKMKQDFEKSKEAGLIDCA